MRPTALRIVAMVAVSLLLLPTFPARADDRTPTQRAVDWLASIPRALPDYDIEAVAALGLDPASWPSTDGNVLAASEAAQDPSLPPVRHLHAVSVAGYERPDLVQAVLSTPADGGFGGYDDPPWNAYAILALRAAGVPASHARIQAAADRLLSLRGAMGGWSTSNSTTAPSATDETGYVLAALAAAGRDVHGDTRAATFLNTTHTLGGGHASTSGPTAKANCQSTVWALRGYAALGLAPPSDDLPFLRSLQGSNGGLVRAAGDDPATEDEMCTAEAAIVLDGAADPMRGVVPISLQPVPALEPATLALPLAYTSAHWTFDDGTTADGVRVTHAFPAAGNATVRVDATGPSTLHRGDITVRVTSARPRLGAFPASVTLARHAPLALDLRNASDPDGRVVAFEIDWGDHNTTTTTTHAYDLPGLFTVTVRAQDDAGGWSDPGVFTAIVQNAAPTILAPARLVADRIHVVAVDVNATDPDGDALALRWTLGRMRGAGAPRFQPDALGNTTLAIVATDPFGAESSARVIVDVVNIAPTIAIDASRPDQEITANATDPDGPPPMLSWAIDGAPASPPIRPGPGEHVVRAVAIDADGATAEATAHVNVDAPRAPPVPPRIDELVAWLANGTLHVTFAAEGNATLRWRSDVGEGAANASSPMDVPLAGATWASATLVVERDGLESTRETGLLVPPAARADPAAPPAPSPTLIAPPAPALPTAPSAAPPQPLEPASVKEQVGAERQVPAAPALLAVLVALLGRRARSG